MDELFRQDIKKAFLTIFCLLVLLANVVAENIRGPLKQVIEIKPEADYSRQITLSAGELVAVQLSQDSPLLTGIDLEIVLTERLKKYAESFALELYDAVNPQPEINMFSFTGNKIFFQILPYMNTIELEIPYGRLSRKQDSPGSYTVNKALVQGRFPLLFTIQNILKGLPDSVLLSDFHIKLKPRLLKKGYLTLNITAPASPLPEKIEIYIDDQLQPPFSAPLLLDAGIHSLLITAENFQEKNSSFLIETGKTTHLELPLQAVGATVLIDMLPGTMVYLDGLKVEALPADRLLLAEGDHTFRFKIGDYSVSKSLYIVEGKTYNISLFFSVDVKEN